MPGAHLSKKVVRCSECQRKLHEVHAGPQRFLGHKLGGMHAVNPGQYSASGWMSRAARRAAVMICEHCYNFLKVEPDLCRGAGAGCVGHWAVLEALGSTKACGGGACLTKLAPKVATGCPSMSSLDSGDSWQMLRQITAEYTIKLPTPALDPVRLHSAQSSLRWLHAASRQSALCCLCRA